MSRTKNNTERRLALVALLIIVLLVTSWIHLEKSFEEDRQTALEAGALRATQIAEVVSQEFDTTFNEIHFILQGIGVDHLDGRDFNASARRALSLLSVDSGVAIRLYSVSGTLLQSTTPDAPRDIAAAGYFSELEAISPQAPRIVVGAPRHDTATGAWVVPVAWPLARAGRAAGYLVAEIPRALFTQRLSRIGLGASDIAGLVRLPDGVVLATSAIPVLTDALVATAIRPRAAGQARSGVAADAAGSPTTGRIFAWNRVGRHDAMVFVTFSRSDLVAPLEANIADDRTYFMVTVGLLLGLALVVGVLALRGDRQRRALAQQEALYHNLFEQNQSIKLISDPATGRILAANQAAVRFYGYSRAQLESMNITQINCLEPEDVRACMAEALKAQRPYFLFPHRLASGEIRRVEVYSGPVEVGHHRLLYSIIHDVTERFNLENRLKASEARYRTLFDMVPAGIVMIDGSGHFSAFNASALQILMTDEASLVRREKPLCDPTGRPVDLKERPSWRALSEDMNHVVLYVEDQGGGRIWISFISRRLAPAADGTPQGAIIAFSDITTLIQQEEKLQIGQLVFDASAEGIMVTDGANQIVAVNRAFSNITGYSAAEVIGRSPAILASGTHDPGFYRAMYESLRSKAFWEGEITNRHKDGHLFVERLVISAVIRPNTGLSGYVGIFSDITARKEKENQLWHQANFDALTGLPNRTLFLDRATQALVLARRRHQPVAILFVDLDRFKPVNDTFGHAVGDDVLKAVALRIQSCVRAEDTVARLGGDEFVVLLPMATDAAAAGLVAAKILNALNETFLIGGLVISIGSCVGVAVADGGNDTAANLLKRADSAMYDAKAAGRGRVSIAA